MLPSPESAIAGSCWATAIAAATAAAERPRSYARMFAPQAQGSDYPGWLASDLATLSLRSTRASVTSRRSPAISIPTSAMSARTSYRSPELSVLTAVRSSEISVPRRKVSRRRSAQEAEMFSCRNQCAKPMRATNSRPWTQPRVLNALAGCSWTHGLRTLAPDSWRRLPLLLSQGQFSNFREGKTVSEHPGSDGRATLFCERYALPGVRDRTEISD